jgi:hypothetical protein
MSAVCHQLLVYCFVCLALCTSATGSSAPRRLAPSQYRYRVTRVADVSSVDACCRLSCSIFGVDDPLDVEVERQRMLDRIKERDRFGYQASAMLQLLASEPADDDSTRRASPEVAVGFVEICFRQRFPVIQGLCIRRDYRRCGLGGLLLTGERVTMPGRHWLADWHTEIVLK